MRRGTKKIITALLITAVLFASGVSIAPVKVEAATRDEAVAWATAQIGKGLDYDGINGNQCVDLIKYYYALFGVAGYAMGNANAYITNNLPSGWTRVYSGYQPGDIAVWKTNHSCRTCSTTGLGHVGIILSADSTGFNAVNQNFINNPTCTKNWFYCSALACAIRPSYSGRNPASVSYSKIGVEWVDNWNAGLSGRIENPDRYKIDNVGVHIWDSAGNMVVNHKEAFGQATSYVNQGLNVVAEALPTGLRSGETYTFQMFAEFNGTSVSSSKGTFTCTDSAKPAIADVKVYDVDENGYTVSCTATDNFKVDRVQFPTWTVANGQDDLVGGWSTDSKCTGSRDGNKFTYRVNRSDHNNEYGIYRTHIYAYDKAGNSICVEVDDVEVKEAAKPDNPIVNGDALVSVAQKEYDTYHGQQYNLQYGSSPWCSNFVSWCARQAGISSDVIQSTATVQVMYDSLINRCGATVVSSPQKGDLVFYKYTNYDSERFHHVGIMTGANETIQGNVNNTWWKGKPDALDNIKQITYVRPAYNGKYVTPGAAYFSEYNLNKVEETNAEVYVKIMNPDRKSVTSVGCELYDANGNLLKSYAENCSFATSYVNYTCNFNNDMKYELSPGTTYRFILNAVVDGQRMNDEQRTFTTKETNGGGKLELQGNSPLTLTDDGTLTGLTQNRNTVKEIAQAFTSQNLVFKDMSGAVLAEDATLGTGATVSVMDGDTVKASCQVVLAGDVTGDGKVNGKDVSMAARSLVGKATLNDAQKSATDVQEDGAVNGKDVSMLARSLVGKSTIASQGK